LNGSHETELERAARHEAEAEAWHVEQSSVIQRMALLGQGTTRAEKLLAELEKTLNYIRDHHQRLLKKREAAGMRTLSKPLDGYGPPLE
jgi:hypothetical protein